MQAKWLRILPLVSIMTKAANPCCNRSYWEVSQVGLAPTLQAANRTHPSSQETVPLYVMQNVAKHLSCHQQCSEAMTGSNNGQHPLPKHSCFIVWKCCIALLDYLANLRSDQRLVFWMGWNAGKVHGASAWRAIHAAPSYHSKHILGWMQRDDVQMHNSKAHMVRMSKTHSPHWQDLENFVHLQVLHALQEHLFCHILWPQRSIWSTALQPILWTKELYLFICFSALTPSALFYADQFR